jgi:hypothetical protein
MTQAARHAARANRPEGYTDQHPPQQGMTRAQRFRAEKRRLFGRTAHTRKTWQAFCRVLRNGDTMLGYIQLVKLSKRIAGQSAR